MALLTQKQLSEELQLTEVTLWKYRKQGMPYKPLGSRLVRYSLPDVLEWLEGRERVVRPFPCPREDTSTNERWETCFDVPGPPRAA